MHDAGGFPLLQHGYSILALAVALLLCVTARAADLPARFDPSRDAAADVARAVSIARTQGKRVIVDVGGEWCSWCHVLDRFIAGNADVQALIDAKYVWVKVNFSKENRNRALLSRWPKIDGYPHLFILDASGRLVHSQDTAALESGKGYDKAKFAAMLRRWSAAGGATTIPSRSTSLRSSAALAQARSRMDREPRDPEPA